MVFIIWDQLQNSEIQKAGGAMMKKIHVAPDSKMTIKMGD